MVPFHNRHKGALEHRVLCLLVHLRTYPRTGRVVGEEQLVCILYLHFIKFFLVEERFYKTGFNCKHLSSKFME